jgi:hypothetical protein
VEARVFCSCGEVVDSVAEFMEEGYYFVVLEEGGLGLGWFGEIADEGGGGVAARAVGEEEAWLEGEVGCVAVFAVAGVEIKVEVADETAAFSFVVPDAEDFDVVVPGNVVGFSGGCLGLDRYIGRLRPLTRNLRSLLTSNLNENEPEELLKDIEHTLNSRLQREVFRNLLLINGKLILNHQTVIESRIPEIVITVICCIQSSRFQVGILDLHQMLNFLCSTRTELSSEIIQEIKDRLRSLGHLVFNDEGSVVWISKKSGSFITENDGFSEEGDVLVALL